MRACVRACLPACLLTRRLFVHHQAFTTLLDKTFEALPFEEFLSYFGQVCSFRNECTCTCMPTNTKTRRAERQGNRLAGKHGTHTHTHTHTHTRTNCLLALYCKHKWQSYIIIPRVHAPRTQEFGETHRDYLFDLYSSYISTTRSKYSSSPNPISYTLSKMLLPAVRCAQFYSLRKEASDPKRGDDFWNLYFCLPVCLSLSLPQCLHPSAHRKSLGCSCSKTTWRKRSQGISLPGPLPSSHPSPFLPCVRACVC
jgi:hypothetical protein